MKIVSMFLLLRALPSYANNENFYHVPSKIVPCRTEYTNEAVSQQHRQEICLTDDIESYLGVPNDEEANVEELCQLVHHHDTRQ